ncbi:MAG: carboxypeptidase regulatory-like domain-containing protein [Candidatus Zixiibacteriota bacterium]
MRRWVILRNITAATIVVVISVLLISTGHAESSGTITGVIIDAGSGVRVSGASVMLVGTNRGVLSDSEGRFSLEGVTPGYHEISITHKDYHSTKVPVNANTTNAGPGEWLLLVRHGEFFAPDQNSNVDGNPCAKEARDDQRGEEIHKYRLDELGAIHGRLTDADNGEPIVGAIVCLEGTARGAMTDPDGYFLILRLAPAGYTAVFTHMEYESDALQNIEVSPVKISECSFRLKKRPQGSLPIIDIRD